MNDELTKIPGALGFGEVMEKPFLRVVFQRGLPQEVGINGCRVEDVIDVAVERIRDYQYGPLACQENEDALRHLLAARESLAIRMRRRAQQGVLNTMARHAVVRTEDEQDDFSATGA